MSALLVVAACAPFARKPAPTPPQAPPTPGTAPIAIAPGHYQIVSERSALTIRVYRAGALANLGHNHVLTSNALTGTLDVASDVLGSRASIALDVASLAVDTPESRAAAGADFTSVPTANDIDGTRRNLMGPKVLDAQAHPLLSVDVRLVSLAGNDATLELSVHVAGHDATSLAHASIAVREGVVRVESQFDVAQTALGMTAFSAAGGALKVADTIQVAVVIEAQIVER